MLKAIFLSMFSCLFSYQVLLIDADNLLKKPSNLHKKKMLKQMHPIIHYPPILKYLEELSIQKILLTKNPMPSQDEVKFVYVEDKQLREELYSKLLCELKIEPKEVLLLTDEEDKIEAAKRLGISYQML